MSDDTPVCLFCGDPSCDGCLGTEEAAPTRYWTPRRIRFWVVTALYVAPCLLAAFRNEMLWALLWVFLVPFISVLDGWDQ